MSGRCIALKESVPLYKCRSRRWPSVRGTEGGKKNTGTANPLGGKEIAQRSFALRTPPTQLLRVSNRTSLVIPLRREAGKGLGPRVPSLHFPSATAHFPKQRIRQNVPKHGRQQIIPPHSIMLPTISQQHMSYTSSSTRTSHRSRTGSVTTPSRTSRDLSLTRVRTDLIPLPTLSLPPGMGR